MSRSIGEQVTLTSILAVSAFLLWCDGGNCRQAQAGDQAADVAQLTKLSNDWDQAIVRKDERAIAGNMAEDFRMIDGSGEVHDKRGFVTDLTDPKLTIHPYSVEEFDVRLLGDTALLSGRSHMTGAHDGKPFTSDYRYIDIYVKRAGQWKIVSVQITKFPKPAG